MVIVSNIYEAAFGSYSPFSTEMLKTIFRDLPIQRPMFTLTYKNTHYGRLETCMAF